MTASSDRVLLSGPAGRLRAATAFIGIAGGALGFYFILNVLGPAGVPAEWSGLFLTAPAAIALGGLLVLVAPIAGAVFMALGAAALIFLFGGVVLGNLVPVVCGFGGAALALFDAARNRGAPAGVEGAADTRQAVDFAVALKDAAIAAVVALALAGPIVGLQTVAGPNNQLALAQHWMPVAIIVAVVFVGRLFLNLFVWQPTAAPRPAGFAWFKRASVGGRPLALIGTHARVIVGVIAIVAAIALPFMPFATRYVMDQSIVVLNYSMLGWGLNIVVGLAGLLDLGYVAFYAVGAYSFALLAHYLDWGFWACLPFAGILAACWGMILGFPVLRLRGDYLAIVTLAFGEIIRIVLRNWDEFTGGPNGLLDIPAPTLFGIPFNRSPDGFAATFGFQYTTVQKVVFLYYIILALALVTNFFSLRMRRLPIGRAWEALREDEIACRSLGINTTNTKLTAFACGAMFGGFAGAFFASRQGFVSPESFNSTESFIILAVVVLGGLGSQLGIVIAVIILNTLFEVLRSLQDYRMLIVGLSMVLIMVWRPRGLISTRHPSIFLKQRRSVSAELVGEGRG